MRPGDAGAVCRGGVAVSAEAGMKYNLDVYFSNRSFEEWLLLPPVRISGNGQSEILVCSAFWMLNSMNGSHVIAEGAD